MLAPDSRVGTSMGPYRIDGLIGVGGMGQVYSATGPDGVRVALKVVKEDLARDQTFRKRFAREAHIAMTVRNPHVVPVLDTGEHEGLPYMVARFIDGQSLEQKLRDEGRAIGETERLTVTVLMSDVRGYSGIAERVEPTPLAGMLNTHRAEMNVAILAELGTVMQYVGDAVMAVFGAPFPQADHADRALANSAASRERPDPR